MNDASLLSPSLLISHLLCISRLFCIEAISSSPTMILHIFANPKWCISGLIGCWYINSSTHIPLGLRDHYLLCDSCTDSYRAHNLWLFSQSAGVLTIDGHAHGQPSCLFYLICSISLKMQHHTPIIQDFYVYNCKNPVLVHLRSGLEL